MDQVSTPTPPHTIPSHNPANTPPPTPLPLHAGIASVETVEQTRTRLTLAHPGENKAKIEERVAAARRAVPTSSTLPSIGRDVWYFPGIKDEAAEGKGQPWPAKITHVFDDGTVNLHVFDDGSYPMRKRLPTNVTLFDPTNVPLGSMGYATWPLLTTEGARSSTTPPGRTGTTPSGATLPTVSAAEAVRLGYRYDTTTGQYVDPATNRRYVPASPLTPEQLAAAKAEELRLASFPPNTPPKG